MTTAARPTFDPARGKDNNAPSFIYSARDLASHTKLKFRQPGQGGANEIGDREQLKEELRRAEAEYYESKNKAASSDRLLTGGDADGDAGGDIGVDDARAKAAAEAAKLAALDKDDSDESEDDEDEDASSEDESDDDDDDEAELMATLQRIRQERAEERERQEAERLQQEQDEKEKEAMTGNPLLNTDEKKDFNVKRRWDDDVIFKNQARGDDERSSKRFVNDMLRSDFHRRFLHKYVQ
ncbi:Pre-mRNA-splicing factor Cwf15/Cwc15 [Gongronella butleri]|nr:Pre-mRNA-splicing factor Cwf15/Cwc15 [Gongronella butleri]